MWGWLGDGWSRPADVAAVGLIGLTSAGWWGPPQVVGPTCAKGQRGMVAN